MNGGGPHGTEPVTPGRVGETSVKDFIKGTGLGLLVTMAWTH